MKAEFQRDHGHYVPTTKPTQQYPIDRKLVGYWQKTERYFSAGMTTYTITQLHLAADGTCSHCTRTVTSPMFQKTAQWADPLENDSGASPKNYGQWGVIDNKFILFLDDRTVYHQTYDYQGDRFCFNFRNQTEIWLRT